MRKKLIHALTFVFILVFMSLTDTGFGSENQIFIKKRIRVFLDKSQLSEGQSPQKELLKKAEKKALKEIVSLWAQKHLLFLKQKDKPFDENFSSFLITKEEFTPNYDSLSTTYDQLFDIKVQFIPTTQVMGDIIYIEGDKALAASYYLLTIKLHELIPNDKGAYFVITKPMIYKEKELLELIGGGKIYRVVNSIAQGIVLVSNQEISKLDKVFLVKTEILPVILEEKNKKVKEVVVEPEIIKEKKAPVPKESK